MKNLVLLCVLAFSACSTAPRLKSVISVFTVKVADQSTGLFCTYTVYIDYKNGYGDNIVFTDTCGKYTPGQIITFK